MMQLPIPSGRRLPGIVIALALAAGPAALPAKAQAPKPASAAGLPGGAQSLSETFEDWQVACAMPQGVKRCAIGQQQADPKTRQRILSVEIQPKGAGAEGLLVLPFGLALDKGVSLKAGEADLVPALRFSTCLPQGCFVPLALDAKALAALRKAAEASVGAVSDGGQPVSFPVSLKGFPAAFDRAAALGS
ncbi:invasion associated locus B family protein [Xanthobacter sp. V0B-10]|uniref:invasion associated locus B family protein n=1 Tax=Xanthobacter albus TaxID=3119929 RepID=UPI00372B35D6